MFRLPSLMRRHHGGRLCRGGCGKHSFEDHQAADHDTCLPRSAWYYIYIDEIDKITRKSGKCFHHRDVYRVKVYSRLFLKILEGTVASVPPQGGRNIRIRSLSQIDTTNISVYLRWRLEGLDKIIETRQDTIH